jgi:hypothetical protein
MKRRTALIASAGLALPWLARPATAQAPYPSRPIRLVVGFAAGGPTDVIARIIAQDMSATLGQPVVVENRTGANALIATQFVARDSPDGYTILLATLSHSVNAILLPNNSYRPLEDFTPIGLVSLLPLIAVTGASTPYRSLQELVSAAKASADSGKDPGLGLWGRRAVRLPQGTHPMSQSKHPKPLSVAQMLILRTAAERPDRMVLPLPPGLRARGASQTGLLTSLLNATLVEEVATGDAALSWRKADDGALHALRITPTGLAAIGHPQMEEMPAQPGSPTVEMSREGEGTSTPAPPRPSGKLGAVLDAVGAEQGATLSELVTATGWLPHTTRAALTGLRKRGFPVHLAERDGRKAYRLAEAG